ncbi:MAG TPA: hypothetical protein VIM12_16375 [Noviherbaspirillum sp.]|jgi:hypothetical protein|uniref:hypothetical protein n=1 Tax=Noviherbaspirillum sp. TaxID=1926288 RepID=UPI002F9219B8
MIQATAIYQRTREGGDEIRDKNHGLTQSERLVLIMVDGIGSVDQLRAKLPVLAEERFYRALRKLEEAGLVQEVLLPVEGQTAEEIDPATIDRYLRQDPHDPLTILFIPDEDDDDWQLAPPVRRDPAAARKVIPAMDEAHIQLAESVIEEVKTQQVARPVKLEPIAFATKHIEAQERARLAQAKLQGWRKSLPYILVFSGLAFLAGFGIARMMV